MLAFISLQSMAEAETNAPSTESSPHDQTKQVTTDIVNKMTEVRMLQYYAFIENWLI